MTLESFDGHSEKQLRDTGVDKGASQSLSQEATGLFLSAWAMRDQFQQHNTSDSGQNGGLFGMMAGGQRDSTGNLVQMDKTSGKLLTQDQNGKTVELDALHDQEKTTNRNAMAMSTLFVGSPLMLFGAGAALTFVDQVQTNDHQKETDRLKQNIDTKPDQQTQQNQQQKPFQAKGYLDEIVKATLIGSAVAKDKRIATHQELYGLMGLGFELFPNQVAYEQSRKSEKEKERKKKTSDKKAIVERQREAKRVSRSVERNNLNTGKLIKRRLQVENAIEHAQGQASLAEVSRLHSELETLDKALARLAALGL
ncbi:MAG: hypothetical protein K2Z81_11335 [Cyanobacteria bacterium]|nr:hypothetical protein [Cyanobacteriota bacterium]